jgi:hypothetical protein
LAARLTFLRNHRPVTGNPEGSRVKPQRDSDLHSSPPIIITTPIDRHDADRKFRDIPDHLQSVPCSALRALNSHC